MLPTIPVIASIIEAATFGVGTAIGVGLGYLAAWLAAEGLRAELASAAWRLAHDPLTGLLNRAGLRAVHAVVAASGRPQPIIAMLIDLDQFKEINDTYGHDSGDDLLMEVADRIAQVADAHGGAAARLSGDEYAAILPVRHHGITDLADRLNATIAEPIEIDTDNGPIAVRVTASVGIAIVASTDPLEDIALHRADTAMYHAKRQGGNQHVHYTSGMAMPPREQRRGPRLRDQRHDGRGVIA